MEDQWELYDQGLYEVANVMGGPMSTVKPG